MVPLGVMPRHLWEKKREQELLDAINRYLYSGLKVKPEWFEEYNELVGRRLERESLSRN